MPTDVTGTSSFPPEAPRGRDVRAPDRMERARLALVRAILWTTFIGSGSCAIIFPFLYDRWEEALVVNSCIALGTLPLLRWAVQGRHIDRIGPLTAALAVSAVVLSILNSGGIRSPAILSFPAALLVAGFAANARATFVAVGTMLLVLMGVVYGESRGMLAGVSRPYSPVELCASFSASLIATAMVIYVSVQALKSAIESAERSERRLRDLIDQSPDGIVTLRDDGTVTSANAAASAIVAGASSGLVGTGFWDLSDLGAESRGALESWIKAAKDGDSTDLATTFRTESGGVVHTRARVRRMHGDDRSAGLLVTLRDESARVNAERERGELQSVVERTQKMQVVGQLAGGVAHDFNNYLAIIRTCSDLIRKKVGPDTKSVGSLLDAISDATSRSTDLTRQLLAFSRKQVMQARLVDLRRLVRSTEPMIRRTLDPRIELNVSFDDAPVTAQIDPSQVEVALLNLVVNARDAMPTGGKLTIETSLVELPPDFSTRHPGAPTGRATMIAVHDTGIGMDTDTLARACEPFFTTKGNLGTGLGLSSVYGIVQQSQGALVLESRPGEGTSVRVFLPFARGDAEDTPAPVETPARGGTETIVLVEDQALLRDVTAAMLRSHGYTVVVFPDAEQAMSDLEGNPMKVDLLLTDVLLPGLDGVGLAHRMRRSRPELPVLLVSGYTDQRARELDDEAEALPLLHKPFATRVLLERLRLLLDPKTP